MKKLLICILCFVFTQNNYAQTQDYISFKNITSADAKSGLRPITSLDTMRLSFVPVKNEKDKKSLVILPYRGLEGSIVLILDKINHVTNYGTIRNIYYDALEKDEKRTVVVTTNDKVLTSIAIRTKLADDITYTLYYTDFKSVFRDN